MCNERLLLTERRAVMACCTCFSVTMPSVRQCLQVDEPVGRQCARPSPQLRIFQDLCQEEAGEGRLVNTPRPCCSRTHTHRDTHTYTHAAHARTHTHTHHPIPCYNNPVKDIFCYVINSVTPPYTTTEMTSTCSQ